MQEQHNIWIYLLQAYIFRAFMLCLRQRNWNIGCEPSGDLKEAAFVKDSAGEQAVMHLKWI